MMATPQMANMSSNGTKGSGQPDERFRLDYDSCLAVLSFMIVLINVLVIYLFLNKDYLRTKTNSFLVSLAFSDLMTGLLTIPLYLICNVTLDTQVCLTSGALYRCIAISTIAHIMVVTLERYVSVMFPMRYYRMVTKSRVCICIAFVWAFSTFYAIIPLFWLNLENHNLIDPEHVNYEYTYNAVGIFVCFAAPSGVIVFCFIRMFTVIRRQVRNIRRQAELSVDPRSQSIASDKRALIIFALMLGIFIVCWLSWYLMLFQVQIGYNAILPEILMDIFDFLRFGTSLFNPMLYTFLKSDFRRAVCSILAGCCVKSAMIKQTPDPNASRATLTTDGNLNKNTVLVNGYSSVSNHGAESRVDLHALPTKQAENLQLISHV